MHIERRFIDDLKSERPDIAPPLAGYLRGVPVFFYAVLVGGAVLSALFFVNLRSSASAEQRWKTEAADLTQKLSGVQSDRTALEREARRATDIVAWVEGSRSLQPLVVSIIRSMEANSSIISLGLARDPVTPTQVKLILKLNSQSNRQLDAILDRVAAENFRTYNPNQTQNRGEVDYEATLLYQNPRTVAPTRPAPAAAAKSSPAPAPKAP